MKKKAVALKYDSEKFDAPFVSAKGIGYFAEILLKKARGNNVPIKDDPVLTDILMTLDTGDCIPEELFKVVAEILAFVYTQNSKYDEILNNDLSPLGHK